MVIKKCPRCNSYKESDYFHVDSSKKDGRCSSCIECNRHKRWDKTKKSAYDKAYRIRLGWRKIAWKFKCSVDLIDEIFVSQDGKCAICKNPEQEMHHTGQKMKLSLDHCHKTGKIRGFLCTKCNKALGLFLDDPSRLDEAAKYLRSYSK